MSILGCTIPSAKNYNPEATEDDGSCVYLTSVGGQCYEFSDVPEEEIVDNSFTLSITLDSTTLKPVGWVYFHDYFPDFYVHTRDLLINLKNSVSFYQSKGNKGIYHFNSSPKPFFIDVLFANKDTMVLNSVKWISEVRAAGNNSTDDDRPALYEETLTHITIWNQYQTSGRIALDNVRSGALTQEINNRNSEQNWNFNDFTDIVKQIDTKFLEDIFKDYSIIPEAVDNNLAWWEKRLIEGKYFIVRFEFDNNNNKQITLNDLDIDASKSYR